MAHSTAFMPSVGESLPAISIPITLQRLVMEAGANRDFSLMHHDGAVAQTAGASDAFANTFFLMGMFERLVREWAGAKARFRKMGPLENAQLQCGGGYLGVYRSGGLGRSHGAGSTLCTGAVVRE